MQYGMLSSEATCAYEIHSMTGKLHYTPWAKGKP